MMKLRNCGQDPAWPGDAVRAHASLQFLRSRLVPSLAAVVLSGFGLDSPLRAAVAPAIPPATETNPSTGNLPAPAQPGAAAAVSAIDEDVSEWRFVSQLSLRAVHDDNITIRPRGAIDDTIFHVAPSLAFGIGNFRTAIAPYAAIPHFIARTGEEDLPRRDYAFGSYTPDAVFFVDHEGENSVNHDLRLAARQERDRWNMHGELRFQRVTEVDLDLGRRARQTFYHGIAGGERDLGGKTRGSLTFRGARTEYSGGFSSTDLRGTTFVDYQVAPKTTLGLGATAGYLLVGSGADQTYQQPLVQAKYQPTAKISLAGQAGQEFRQFDSDIENRDRFVFAFHGDYAASDATTFNVAARRETQSSAQYSGENIVATLYQAGIRQRFLQRVYVGLNGGQVRNHYENNAVMIPVARRDRFHFYKASASLDVTRRGTLELSYEYRDNDSTLPDFTFEQNLVTLAASILF